MQCTHSSALFSDLLTDHSFSNALALAIFAIIARV